MILAFKIVAMIAFIGAGLAGLVIVGTAFRESFARGLKCIFIPGYIILYALSDFNGPLRLLVQFVFFVGIAVGCGMFALAYNADPTKPIFR